MRNPPTILLDVDEVLADFVGGALKVHGWTRERLETVWPAGIWSILEPMGLTCEAFWAPIDAAGEAFWEELSPTPWVEGLLTLMRAQAGLTAEWYLVTSPSLSAASYSGKVKWIRNQLDHYFPSPFGTPSSFDRIVMTGYKHLLANPRAVLIDDRESNTTEFVRYGGKAILFPSRHNYLYRFADDPLSYVSPVLKNVLSAMYL